MSSKKHERAKQRRAKKAADRRKVLAAFAARVNQPRKWLSPEELEAVLGAMAVSGFEGLTVDEAMARLEREWGGAEDEQEKAEAREWVRAALLKRDGGQP